MRSIWEDRAHLLGPCHNCGDGPCREETADVSGWPDLGFLPGDVCNGRPFKDEETARMILNDSYRSTGSELYSFWEGARRLWIGRHGVGETLQDIYAKRYLDGYPPGIPS